MENMVILGRSKRSGEQLALFEEPNVTASLVPFPARQGTWDIVVNTPPPPQLPLPTHLPPTPRAFTRLPGFEETLPLAGMVFTLLNNTRTLHFNSPSLWLHCRNSDCASLGEFGALRGDAKSPTSNLVDE